MLSDGQIVGRYQIVRLLGQGGMGAVYEALHVVLKKRFAIKTLLPAIAQMPEARARFLREGEAASRINHPNVVGVSDVGTEGDMPYLVMELLDGQSLAELLEQRRRLEIEEAVDILLPVISAVSAGHDQGVIHRDLKPPNIFLTRGGWGGAPVPKVLDFGVSKMTGGDGAALTGTLAVLGTAAYMSPEQARGARNIDGQSDQYALGLILYETLTGARAHPGDSPLEVIHHIANGTMIPPGQLRPDLPDGLVAVLIRMLARAATERYPTLRAVGSALLPFAGADTRVAMRHAFREPDAGPAAADGGPVANRTLLLPEAPLPAVGAGAGGTRLLPQPGKPAQTTLGQAASLIGEGGELSARARTRRTATGAGLVAVVAGVVVALVLMRHKQEPSAASSPSDPVTAPSAAVTPPVPTAPDVTAPAKKPEEASALAVNPSPPDGSAEQPHAADASHAADKKLAKKSKKPHVPPSGAKGKLNEDIF